MEKKIKVLMVDDEAPFRATTDKILTRRGFETVMAESGNAAIEKLSENPDVVILDIKMAGLDGIETLKIIKKRKPDLPVIMLTGHGDQQSAIKAYKEGAFDYLTKPCDIDVMVGKIRDAHKKQIVPKESGEKSVKDIMIPIAEYTTVTGDITVKAAIAEIKKSFTARLPTSKIMETGHRSVIVLDEVTNRVKGILTIADLMKMIMPAYLFAPKPSLADTIQYSPMFWKGMFTTDIRRNASVKVREVMSPAPHTIDGNASLMEATYMMVQHRVRRLVVTLRDEVVGIIREQDLFFEMEKILGL